MPMEPWPWVGATGLDISWMLLPASIWFPSTLPVRNWRMMNLFGREFPQTQLSKTKLTQFARLPTIAGIMNHVPPSWRALRSLEVDRPNDLDSSSFARKN